MPNSGMQRTGLRAAADGGRYADVTRDYRSSRAPRRIGARTRHRRSNDFQSLSKSRWSTRPTAAGSRKFLNFQVFSPTARQPSKRGPRSRLWPSAWSQTVSSTAKRVPISSASPSPWHDRVVEHARPARPRGAAANRLDGEAADGLSPRSRPTRMVRCGFCLPRQRGDRTPDARPDRQAHRVATGRPAGLRYVSSLSQKSGESA